MPRGIPNAKRDDMGMKFTSFHVPLPANPKHTNSGYLRSDAQTIWARNGRNRAPEEQTEGRRGSKVIVIHPGSRWLQIGRASDVTPVIVPHVIARKHNPPVPPVPPLKFIPSISHPREPRKKSQDPPSEKGEEDTAASSEDPFDAKLALIASALRERMRFYKLRVTPNAVQIANSFNERFEPEVIADYNDPFRIDWMYEAEGDFIVGEKVSKISDPVKMSYAIKYPIYSNSFNTRDYSSLQAILNDLEVIWTTTLQEKLNIEPKTLKDYSVILVIPDIWEKVYVRELLNLLLNDMGFKQVCVQQHSLAATYGAGVSNACVVDIGATKTSITCVDDGMVIPETRLLLNLGGDDITEFLYVLLERISFPCHDFDLARSYDWDLMEDLKARLCTLNESEVALNLYDFVVRRPGKSTEKYGLRAYDEVILAPMCLFLPSVVDFERKRTVSWSILNLDVTDGVPETIADRITGAMKVSTEYLFSEPLLPGPVIVPIVESQAPIISQNNTPATEMQLETLDSSIPQTSDSTTPNILESTTSENSSVKAEENTTSSIATAQEAEAANGIDVDVDMEDNKAPESFLSPNLPSTLQDSDVHLQAIELRNTPQQPPNYLTSLPVSGHNSIDVYFEASKLPLDVAIVNSPRGTQQDEKVRKYLQAVLVIGGTARLPGMVHALESRLQANANSVVSNMDKVQIIPSPKDVDPRVLAWKGAAVLGKMDGVSDLWVNAAEWNLFGLRGLKERCYFL